MNIKLGDLIKEEKNINEISEIKLPVSVSFKIKKLVNKIQPDFVAYREKRLELYKEYGEYNKENDTYSVKLNKEFNQKIEDLENVDVNIDFEKIKIEELGNVNIEPRLLVEWIFD